MTDNWQQHRLINLTQTVALVAVLLGLTALVGGLLFGGVGVWVALGVGAGALLLPPAQAAQLTLRLYWARPIPPWQAPELTRWVVLLARRAGLPAAPRLYHVPSAMVNAFAVGSREDAAVALTDGLLRTLNERELAAVLAHETAHIANNDLRVMSLADSVSRLTSLFALVGQVLLLLSIPLLLVGEAVLSPLGLLLLLFSPQIAMLVQLGLSRVREFDADLTAARLTDDPEGLALALARLDRAERSWRAWLFPGWGNPEPSWLRTHPPTAARIARLLSLPRPSVYLPRQLLSVDLPPAPPRSVRPRWYPGGLWR